MENPHNKKYQICTKTIMDTSDPNIVFNEKEKVIIMLISNRLSNLHGTPTRKATKN